MKGTTSASKRVEQIEAKARQVLEEHGLYAIPADPVTLANKLGIKVQNAVFSDPNLSGMVARREGISSILVNANDHPVRKRFTIAHELGHRLLHLEQDGEFIDYVDEFRETEPAMGEWTPERQREYEANVFAAALLMDAGLVRKAWEEHRSLPNLARLFNVSEIAMSYRLQSLGVTA